MRVLDPNYLVDAGPLVGLLARDDQWYKWSAETLSAVTGVLVTTETVVAEACYLLRKRRAALRAIMDMLGSGALRIHEFYSHRAARLGQLLEDYSEMDFGDATVVVLSERFPSAKLITIDIRDFRIYRRSDGSPVPIITPPKS